MEELMHKHSIVRVGIAAAALALAGLPASAQAVSALAQLQAQAGPSYTPAAAPAPVAAPVVVPYGGYQQQNQAWDELVRPLGYYAQQQDSLDRAFASWSAKIQARTLPGNTLWGKDIVERNAFKLEIGQWALTLQAEQRNKAAAYALAWRLYCRGESARLDPQGQALAKSYLQRLTAPEKDVNPVVSKLVSMRQGAPGLIPGMMDSSIAQGLDWTIAADRDIRRITGWIRIVTAPQPQPQPQAQPAAK